MVRTHFLWALVLILLFVGLLVQLWLWRDLRETETRLSVKDFHAIAPKYRQLRTQITQAEEQLKRLESETLWQSPDQILPLLAKLASASDVQLIGVEELPSNSNSRYLSFPLRLTFSGEYVALPRLLAVVEKISPPIRIDEFRIYQRPRHPDTLSMSLSVTPMGPRDFQNATGVVAETDIPLPSTMIIKRDPFVVAIDDAPPTPRTAENHTLPEIPLPKLTGILWNDAQPIAIFTDHLKHARSLRVGETISDAKVAEIHPQHVVLLRGKQKHEIPLWEEDNGFSFR